MRWILALLLVFGSAAVTDAQVTPVGIGQTVKQVEPGEGFRLPWILFPWLFVVTSPEYVAPNMVGLDYVDLFLVKRDDERYLVGVSPTGDLVYVGRLP